jgi:hypothetical protein
LTGRPFPATVRTDDERSHPMEDPPPVNIPPSVKTLFEALQPALSDFGRMRGMKVLSYDHLKAGDKTWIWNLAGEFFNRQVTIQIWVDEPTAQRSCAFVNGYVWFTEPKKGWIKLTAKPMDSPDKLIGLLSVTVAQLIGFLWQLEAPANGEVITA